MDGKRFDELTRVMGAGASRRRVIKGLAAGVGGGLVALVGRRAPGALAAGLGEACTDSMECDSGLSCINDRCQACGPYNDMSVFCPAGQYCDVNGTNGVCADCACGPNEVCGALNADATTGQPIEVCTCPNVVCDGACCAANQECLNGACADVGGLGEPCATGDLCNSGLACINDRCQECGPYNDMTVFCPAGQYCDVSGYNGVCADCACADNQVCGAVNADTTTGAAVDVCSCAPAYVCGDACCDTGMGCYSGACKAAGDLGDPCSGTLVCGANLFCIPNAANPDHATDATAGYCEECNPHLVEAAVCPSGQYCDVSGQFGTCADCNCPNNDICAPANYDANGQPVADVCSCPNVACGEVCCDAGMLCGDGDVCVECVSDGDCVSGEICQNNVCVGVECTSDSMCNTEAGQICDETNHTCQCANETCGAGTAKVCCAANEVCNADGGCSVSCNKDADCASGEHCDTKAGYCVANECAKDTDCPGSKVCGGGVCVAQCSKDADCAKGDVCTDGTCTAGEAENGGSENGGNGTTTLPNTGVGRGKSGGSSWLGAAMIGGAAALLAGKKLRQDAAPTDAE